MTEFLGVPRKYAQALAAARVRLTLSDEIGLALRDHRRALGMSQRSYAASRGLSRAMVARLESGAGRLSLDTVVSALEGTGFALAVTFDSIPPETPALEAAVPASLPGPEDLGHGSPVPPEAWQPTDLIARVRGGSRRFPAHRVVQPVTEPPRWWWIHEFFAGPTERPQWYAPVPLHELLRIPEQDTDDPTTGAA
jgi:transcriptional regulator with XRE-family HTH domain